MFQGNWSVSQGENLTIINVLSVIYILTIVFALFFQSTNTNIYNRNVKKKRYNAEEAAELLTADNDPDGNDLQSSSEDDLSSIAKDENQPILSNSDSDDAEASLTSSESEPDDDDEQYYNR